jgi:hypothetical protein
MDSYLQKLRRGHLEGDPQATLQYYHALTRADLLNQISWQEQLSIGQVLLANDLFPPIPITENFNREEKRELIVGITDSDEIYALQPAVRHGSHPNFSMCGSSVYPILRDQAVERARDSWIDLFEDPDELQSLNERFDEDFTPEAAADFVQNVDGELHGFDDSLIPDEIYLTPDDAEPYIFGSSGCGQYKADVSHPLIPEALLDYLMEVWDRYHLQPVNVLIPDYPQDREAVLREAILFLLNEN